MTNNESDIVNQVIRDYGLCADNDADAFNRKQFSEPIERDCQVTKVNYLGAHPSLHRAIERLFPHAALEQLTNPSQSMINRLTDYCSSHDHCAALLPLTRDSFKRLLGVDETGSHSDQFDCYRPLAAGNVIEILQQNSQHLLYMSKVMQYLRQQMLKQRIIGSVRGQRDVSQFVNAVDSLQTAIGDLQNELRKAHQRLTAD